MKHVVSLRREQGRSIEDREQGRRTEVTDHTSLGEMEDKGVFVKEDVCKEEESLLQLTLELEKTEEEMEAPVEEVEQEMEPDDCSTITNLGSVDQEDWFCPLYSREEEQDARRREREDYSRSKTPGRRSASRKETEASRRRVVSLPSLRSPMRSSRKLAVRSKSLVEAWLNKEFQEVGKEVETGSRGWSRGHRRRVSVHNARRKGWGQEGDYHRANYVSIDEELNEEDEPNNEDKPDDMEKSEEKVKLPTLVTRKRKRNDEEEEEREAAPKRRKVLGWLGRLLPSWLAGWFGETERRGEGRRG